MCVKRIKYFTFHGSLSEGKLRNNSPAADTKVDYIVTTLNRIGYGVDVISLAPSSEPYFIPSSVEISNENHYRYFASLGFTKSPLRIFNRWLMKIQFILWCLFNLKVHEEVIVYHSLGYDNIFIMLKKLIKIRIIGEIEEIYQDVSKQSAKYSRNEYRFIDLCDKYIFPTQLLDKRINLYNKPAVIVHGIYSRSKIIEQKFSDGKVHVVYGGTLDPNKGGAFAAVESAIHLSSRFHIHICGFGDSTMIKNIIKTVQENTDATITFEGELLGDEYTRFIQKCHIGLSTQNPEAKFNDTSFPSKILVYLSNGLKVVSVRIPVIEESAIVDNVFFYDKQTSEKIAESIVYASEVEQIGCNVLEKLDRMFTLDIMNLINT